MAVRRGFRHDLARNGALGAGSVIDHYRLAQNFGERLRDKAGDGVRGPSGGKRHDGANRPPHGTTVRRGIPPSTIVGTPGSRGLLTGSKVASARSFPSLTRGVTMAPLPNIMCTRASSRSGIASGSPLYGTCTISSLPRDINCAVARTPMILPDA